MNGAYRQIISKTAGFPAVLPQFEENRMKEKNYSAFNSFVGEYLSKLGIKTDKMRYKLDGFLWNQKKVNEK